MVFPDSAALVDALGTAMAYAPDGSVFAYNSRLGLMLRFADRLDAVPVAGGRRGTSPFFSPDGRWLGFQDAARMVKVPLAGGTPVAICDSCIGYSFSWDGDDTVRYHPAPSANPNSRVLMAVSARGGTPYQIASPDNSATEAFRAPMLIPGTRTVLFSDYTGSSSRLAALDRRVLLIDPHRGLHQPAERGVAGPPLELDREAVPGGFPAPPCAGERHRRGRRARVRGGRRLARSLRLTRLSRDGALLDSRSPEAILVVNTLPREISFGVVAAVTPGGRRESLSGGCGDRPNRPGGGMRHRMKLSPCVVMLAMWGCGEGAVDPGVGGGGEEIATRFEQLADSVEGEDWSPTAEALRHAAQIVRLAGGATAVTLMVDGAERSFLAVAEQLDFPNIVCSWPGDSGVVVPGDSTVVEPAPEPSSPERGEGECEEVGTYSMRTFIAWEPERLAEVVRVVGDLGSQEVEPGVPDVMTGLPATGATGADGETPPEPGDTAGGGGGTGGYPGFIGEYLVRDVGSFWAVEGTQTNALAGAAGSCTEDRTTFDWAEFSCEAARFRFEFRMRVEAARYDPATGWDPGAGPGGAEGSHELTLGSSEVKGVRLRVVAWVPPPLPPPLPPDEPVPVPPPVDSTGVSPDGATPTGRQ